MGFLDGNFLILLVITFIAYWSRSSSSWQNIILLVASFVFYAWANPWFALLLFAFTSINFGLALWIEGRPGNGRAILFLGIIANLFLLTSFKYFNFFLEGTNAILKSIGLDFAGFSSEILLPLGLSFYSLQAIAYLVDVANKRREASRSWIEFAVFISFFPKMIAGPIERAKSLLPQLNVVRHWDWQNIDQGVFLLVQGYLLKVVVANNLAGIVAKVFLIEHPPISVLFPGTFAFAVQIFSDFAGYTAIARGFALLFGIRLVENFNQPYLALTPGDFWERWHISLSTWLRDYIFYPLQRALKRWLPLNKAIQFWFPPILTMLASGLWHGTGWTFVVWGIYHGLLIGIYQVLGMGSRWRPAGWLRILSAWSIMSALTLVGWFLFRAPDLQWLAGVFTGISLGLDRVSLFFSLRILSEIIFLGGLIFLYSSLQRWAGRPNWIDGVYVAVVASAVLIFLTSKVDFIYAGF